jgi:hypothetical protein
MRNNTTHQGEDEFASLAACELQIYPVIGVTARSAAEAVI